MKARTLIQKRRAAATLSKTVRRQSAALVMTLASSGCAWGRAPGPKRR